MPYQPNIPLATDQLSQSQGDIQGNFQTLSTWVQVDHTNFDTVNQGQHNFTTFPQQAVDPANTATASDLRLYNKAYNAGVDPSNRNEVYLQRMDASPSIPITATKSSAGLGAVGYTYLPSGVLIKWGAGTCVAGTVIINTAGNGPNFNAMYNVQLTARSDAGTVGILAVNQITATTFTVTSTAANTQFIWVAFGLATTP